jgi:hypothetical protein
MRERLSSPKSLFLNVSIGILRVLAGDDYHSPHKIEPVEAMPISKEERRARALAKLAEQRGLLR